MKIILASKSPRRRELMNLLKIDYTVMVSDVDEVLEKELSIEEQSKKLGYIKAKAVFDITHGDRIIIGSDTMVIKDGELYGKPTDKKDAIRMLKKLQNSMHQVITSVAILVQKGESYEEYIEYEITEVYISKMTDKEINQWIEEGNVYDKAGAYAIQSEFAKFVDKINGNYDSIVGLPINKVYKILKKYI